MQWRDVSRAVPELATKVQSRFEKYGLALLATVRRDGAPRISGIETFFGEGELWLGMMPGSMKAKDLLREPRFALHSATVDKDVKEGDAKIAGRALHVEDEATFLSYRRATGAGTEQALGSFHLFSVDVKGMSFLMPAGDHLVVEWWTESGGYRQTNRF